MRSELRRKMRGRKRAERFAKTHYVVIVRHLVTVMVMEYVRRLCWNG